MSPVKHITYTVVVERGPENFGAYVPDLPGCVAVGDNEEEVLRLIREAIAFHIEGLLEDGEPVPPSTMIGREMEVELAG